MHRVIARCARAQRPREDRGQTMAEYGILLGLISVAIILALTTIGVTVTGFFMSVANAI